MYDNFIVPPLQVLPNSARTFTILAQNYSKDI